MLVTDNSIISGPSFYNCPALLTPLQIKQNCLNRDGERLRHYVAFSLVSTENLSEGADSVGGPIKSFPSVV